jgi:hypothetical protein
MYDDSSFNETIETLLEEIAALSPDNVLTFIEKKLPGWLLYYGREYVPECANFEDNWKNKMCKLFHVEPQSILIVKKIVLPYGPEYKKHIVLMRYCDLLTKFGYCVRSNEHFNKCQKCDKIKQKNAKVKHNCEKIKE